MTASPADQRMSRAARIARTTAGLALVAGGSALLFLPGPGLLIIGAGVALMPGGPKRLARWIELASRRRRRAELSG